MHELLGGKGANLAEMCNLGLNIPPGFTLSTNLCEIYNKDSSLAQKILDSIHNAIKNLENLNKQQFGGTDNPLLLSVRSGSPVSMPGMLDTILNLGMNDDTVIALGKIGNSERFAQDSYRRFIQMYGEVVMNIDHSCFANLLIDLKEKSKVKEDSDLNPKQLENLVKDFKKLILDKTGKKFPQDPFEQLKNSIYAVFASWKNNRAVAYRRLNNISEDIGTAVNIQTMVFGNKGSHSSSGVVFTRNPSTGQNELFGEYLPNAQGEDVVAGIRTPNPISKANKEHLKSNLISLEEKFPELFQELQDICTKLELHYKDLQDIEFTIQEGNLWILQTRSGKRSQKASLRVVVDMVKEGIITPEEALNRIDPQSISQLLHPTIDSSKEYKILTSGLPASPGAACGKVVFTSKDVHHEKVANKNSNIILVRTETTPEDIEGMALASGILTTKGGMTSHAAVVARGMGKPCICGAGEIIINYKDKHISIGDIKISEGEIITLNGCNGDVIHGKIETNIAEISDEFNQVLEWSKEFAKIQVRANADSEEDAKKSLEFNVDGIGLCRTEHMFFQKDRILAVREMIVASSDEARKLALEKILPMQKEDFLKIFKIMKDKPTNIRLLDPPLHEFLTSDEDVIKNIASITRTPIDKIKDKISKLHEINPMLGHRGCRLGITSPSIYEMQVSAIISAAAEIQYEQDIKLNIEIMVPLVMNAAEYCKIKLMINKTAQEIMRNYKTEINYSIGVMIELPIAAINAGEIAQEADFMCFGTNDLTQTALGISRDDSSKFIPTYIAEKLFEADPFILIRHDVIELMNIAIRNAREVKPDMKIGVCGEHGGDPESIKRFRKIGIDYVSCSPYRIPVAKIAASHNE